MEFRIMILLLAAFPAQAATTLTWPSCVDLAVKNNAELQVSQAQLRSQESSEKAAFSTFLPKLKGSVGYSQGDAYSINNSNSTNTTTAYSTSLNLSQNLFAGFQDQGQLEIEGLKTRSSRLRLQITKAKVSHELKVAFESLRNAQDYQKLAQEILRRREDNLRLVNLRFESGRENKGSVLLSEAYLSQSQYDQLLAQNALRTSRALLMEALGQDNLTDVEVLGGLPLFDPEPTPAFEKIATETPAYLIVVNDEKIAELNRQISRASFYPSLDLSGTVTQIGEQFPPEDTRRWSVGFTLSFPFFNGGKDYNNARSATAAHEASTAERTRTRRDILVQIEQAYATYAQATAKLKVDENFRKAAFLRAEIARKRYNNGLVSFEDWDLVENDLINRQKNYLQSLRDRVEAESAWIQAQGKGAIP